MPSMSKPRDHSDLQDMYRHALAASWASQLGELPPDQCIENIFAGGDGWKDKYTPKLSAPPIKVTTRSESVSGDEQSQRSHVNHRKGSTASSRSQNTIKDGKRSGHRKDRRDAETGELTGIQTILSSESSPEQSERGRGKDMRYAHEVNEFDIMDDLGAWQLPREVRIPS